MWNKKSNHVPIPGQTYSLLKSHLKSLLTWRLELPQSSKSPLKTFPFNIILLGSLRLRNRDGLLHTNMTLASMDTYHMSWLFIRNRYNFWCFYSFQHFNPLCDETPAPWPWLECRRSPETGISGTEPATLHKVKGDKGTIIGLSSESDSATCHKLWRVPFL